MCKLVSKIHPNSNTDCVRTTQKFGKTLRGSAERPLRRWRLGASLSESGVGVVSMRASRWHGWRSAGGQPWGTPSPPVSSVSERFHRTDPRSAAIPHRPWADAAFCHRFFRNVGFSVSSGLVGLDVRTTSESRSQDGAVVRNSLMKGFQPARCDWGADVYWALARTTLAHFAASFSPSTHSLCVCFPQNCLLNFTCKVLLLVGFVTILRWCSQRL